MGFPMKIRMIALQAGPAGVRNPGEVHDVEDAEGDALVASGAAEAVPVSTKGKGKAKPKGKGK